MKKLWIFLATGVAIAVVLFIIFGKKVVLNDQMDGEPLGV